MQFVPAGKTGINKEEDVLALQLLDQLHAGLMSAWVHMQPRQLACLGTR